MQGRLHTLFYMCNNFHGSFMNSESRIGRGICVCVVCLHKCSTCLCVCVFTFCPFGCRHFAAFSYKYVILVITPNSKECSCYQKGLPNTQSAPAIRKGYLYDTHCNLACMFSPGTVLGRHFD